MRPLPEGGVEAFERVLRDRWTSGSWHLRRGALACSFGMLGLRWCEVEVMQPGDLDAAGGVLEVRTRKRGQPRRIEAPSPLLAAALRMRAEVAGGEELVFVRSTGRAMNYHDIRRYVATVTKLVLGRTFSFHCFRHTAAVRVYRRTGDVLAVQRYLGHKSLMWTQAYLVGLEVVDVGGPIAFAGGGKPGVRVFDPEGAGAGPAKPAQGQPRAEEAAGDRGAGRGDRDPDPEPGGAHRCEERLVPIAAVDRGWLAGRCDDCGAVWEWRCADRSDARRVSEGSEAAAGAAAELREVVASHACVHAEVVEQGCGRDGRPRMVCSRCGVFVGYQVPEKERKGKRKAGRKRGKEEPSLFDCG